MDNEILNGQNSHWESSYSSSPDKFGANPSEAVKTAVQRFKDSGVVKILELGGGQGRDTLYFAP